MRRIMLRAKLHRVRVTHSEPDYEGSVAIDGRLLDAADIREYERIEVYNLKNGERFSTYAIRAQDGSGIVSVNGAAAHRADPGDIVIICAYAEFEEKELAAFKPRLVYVDDNNRITHTRNSIPVQVA
ncbi:MAG: aspartate 1-decarboxylase [Candidatus Muproteobacteria bacterium RIFCSPHIGHO2_01_FULL_65_16]|uniref:Aspartate 1-decarboxylase n=2 Tax=Candidatus Muproteobacteria TaxID=1817795 RepID=A0A1F6TPM6_9PROT|nr:MAG: aspartate 1-decarboxylase [Candidatus Muproteobacteria bacterium RIFCSPHIGHO2_01_FULL_65_16]OGI48487.1 MAG: aspartate 1-decarboxylase [Candidatus Muproteobacteria bacterium RIFCSPHIGHO2_02_FULL_65_16]